MNDENGRYQTSILYLTIPFIDQRPVPPTDALLSCWIIQTTTTIIHQISSCVNESTSWGWPPCNTHCKYTAIIACRFFFRFLYSLSWRKAESRCSFLSKDKNGQNIVSYYRVFIFEESKLPNRITRTTADDADKHFKKLLNWRNKTNNGQIASIFLCELGVYFS